MNQSQEFSAQESIEYSSPPDLHANDVACGIESILL